VVGCASCGSLEFRPCGGHRGHLLVAALGIDSQGFKHPLGLMEGATEHSAVVQALIDDLIERGLDPAVPRLFIIDGSKALAKAIRRSPVVKIYQRAERGGALNIARTDKCRVR
jgi:putative transposase